MYEDRSQHDNTFLFHSSASPEIGIPPIEHDGEVDVVGPAVPPLDFPTPTIGQTEYWTNVTVVDHLTGRRVTAKRIIVPLPPPRQRSRKLANRGVGNTNSNNSNNIALAQPNHAYLTKKRISRSLPGQLRLCVLLRPRAQSSEMSVLLRPRAQPSEISSENDEELKTIGEWETTDELVVLKSSQRDLSNGRNPSVFARDPLSEVAAQQYVGNYHPHVLGCHEAFQDDECIYTVLPYCPGRDLYKTLVGEDTTSSTPRTASTSTTDVDSTKSNTTSSSSSSRRLRESHAREWFGHLLEGLAHLRRKGVCHGGLCLENILIDEDGNLVIADLGLALRIPYVDESNMGGGGISDVSDGSSRRLIRCLVPAHLNADNGGNPLYMAPEMIHLTQEDDAGLPWNKNATDECSFDGFAVDLWSLGVVLFVMLTGSAPFRIAHPSDVRFVQICYRGLLDRLPGLQALSPRAIHLLQNMLWADPLKRLTLGEIMMHPWVNPPDATTVHSTKSIPPSYDVEEVVDHRPSKKRLHHLSYYHLHSLGGGHDTMISNCGLGLPSKTSISRR